MNPDDDGRNAMAQTAIKTTTQFLALGPEGWRIVSIL